MRTRLSPWFQPQVGGSLGPVADAADAVRRYHDRTKHHLQGFAAGPDTLDWDAQPAPFRHWAGAARSLLPLKAEQWPVTWGQVRQGQVAPAPLDRQGVALLLEMALAITAWKRLGPDRWALRANPSSGNLHPTEAYVLTRAVPGLPDGLCHHDAEHHALEQRAAGRLLGAGLGPGLWLGLSSIAWREAWKYGERAFRYVELDMGHALGAVCWAAAALGWQVRVDTRLNHAQLAALLGLDRAADFGQAEREEPEMLLAIGPPGMGQGGGGEALHWSGDVAWTGQASLLDPRPLYRWPVIDEVREASRQQGPGREGATEARVLAGSLDLGPSPRDDWPASRLLRERRSAQQFDRRAVMPLAACQRLLASLMPGAASGSPLWAAWPGPHQVQLVVYAHRVDGLPAGAYLLPRTEAGGQALAALLQAPGALKPVAGWPAGLPLQTLSEHPALSGTLRTLSCHQAIGSDACLAFSLIAPFDTAVHADPHAYRQLLREAGLIGQALYVNAEAEGLRGTGIGCYFDDAVHDLLGLPGAGWQVLYHFTVGQPLVDARLQSEPPYTPQRQAQDTPFELPRPEGDPT